MYNLKHRFPFYGFVGFFLMFTSWYLNWHLTGLRTHYLFFPLWLGYCLVIDSVTFWIKGSSLLKRNIKKYFSLFLISIPVWWFFELINTRTQNWLYLGRDQFTNLEYFLWASLCFSTVIPAVFGTSELVGEMDWIKKIKRGGPRIPDNKFSLFILLFAGIITLLLLFVWPNYFYIFLWLSVFLMLDSINAIGNRRSLVYYTDKRIWRPLITLTIACLACGFLWEMWNFYAYPKWVYNTPGVEFLYIFEMPILGYLGYIPFSFELFAFYVLITNSRNDESTEYYFNL